ncbi:hypothetical protein B0T14DRAFT_524043, partial [Immersiella caudata]
MDEWDQIHVDHCIDVLRQHIQCHVDLTPLPVKWSDLGERPYVEFNQTHTCRSYKEARKWGLERTI